MKQVGDDLTKLVKRVDLAELDLKKKMYEADFEKEKRKIN